MRHEFGTFIAPWKVVARGWGPSISPANVAASSRDAVVLLYELSEECRSISVLRTAVLSTIRDYIIPDRPSSKTRALLGLPSKFTGKGEDLLPRSRASRDGDHQGASSGCFVVSPKRAPVSAFFLKVFRLDGDDHTGM